MKTKTKYFIQSLLISLSLLTMTRCLFSETENLPSSDNALFLSTTNIFTKPNPSAPPETIQLDKLIGEWNCISDDLVTIDGDSSVWFANKATWRWEYMLGGHALLNHWWQEDNSPNSISKEYYVAGIFIFNPDDGFWEAAIMNSRLHKISPKFQLHHQSDRLEMHDGSGKWLATFFNITTNTFEWKYEVLADDNQWKAISKIHAKRSN